MNWKSFFNKIIEYSFYLLLFTAPLILTPYNYELFEFNKMMLVYAMTVIIVGAWIGKWIVSKKIEIRRTPLDIPILLFFISQLLSTILSIDRRTSIWGYYSRFHGGLLSTISYILLYYAFVSNMIKSQKSKVKSQKYNLKFKNNQNRSTINNQQLTINCIYILLASAALITFYGILEHFGIDAQYWVQDVRNRVFSTLGQPNWLGAWIDGIIFIPAAFLLKNQVSALRHPEGEARRIPNRLKFSSEGDPSPARCGIRMTGLKRIHLIYYSLFILFYLCLLFTGSRSAFFGFLAAAATFLSLIVFFSKHPRGVSLKKVTFLLASFLFVIFSFLYEWKKIPILKFTTLGLFVLSLGLLQINLKKQTLKIINILLACLIIFSLWLGTPVSPPINKLIKNLQPQPKSAKGDQPLARAGPSQRLAGLWSVPLAETTYNLPPKTPDLLPLAPGISESSDIRKVVWSGALDVWRHWPIFGSGVETFAYSYYNFRPRAHNDLSEWDFLYNKAHNEYLNYLATTGIVGLGSYLLLIVCFLFWCTKIISNFQFLISNQIPNPKSQNFKKLDTKNCLGQLEIRSIRNSKHNAIFSLIISLIAGYLSILVTNFFGFSVVPVALLFWLFPAFSFSLTDSLGKTFSLQVGSPTNKGVVEFQSALDSHFYSNKKKWKKKHQQQYSNITIEQLNNLQYFLLIILLLLTSYFLLLLGRFWWADYKFAQGKKYAESGYLLQAHQQFLNAVQLNKGEPLFHSYLGENAAAIALAYHQQQAKTQPELVKVASEGGEEKSELAGTQASLANEITPLVEQFRQLALLEAEKTLKMNSVHLNYYKTAAKTYIYLAQIEPQFYQKAVETLKTAAKLSPTDAKIFLNLALFYQQMGQNDKAIESLEKTVKLKPNYLVAHLTLAKLYHQEGQKEKAAEELKFILTNIEAENAEAKTLLEKWEREKS